MSTSTKRIVAIATIAVLIFTTIFATYTFMSSPTDQTATETQPPITPLDTKSTKVYATYEGGAITEGEVNLYANINFFFQPMLALQLQQSPDLKQEIAKQLATKKFMASKIQAPANFKDETNKQFESLKQAIEQPQQEGQDPVKMEDQFKQYGFTPDDLRKVIEQDFLVDLALSDRIKNLEYDYVNVNHVLVGTEIAQAPDANGNQVDPIKRSDADALKRALEAKQKLDQSKGDFKTIAKEYSDDAGSKEIEGKIEGPADQFVQAFKDASLTLPIGKISDPIKSDYGYHVMRVNERKKMKVGDSSEETKEMYKQQVFAEIAEKEVKYQAKDAPAPTPQP
ncbi:peptidylprolyl isomerase [Risungbinella massiliensis]|uniref:peptidylprolyl isomerase n=1 Tax=Risungbinella massiliensis TaxID=1329796 RepID=UPI0005CC426E|nr:peptidylprolyl isomerase [Risungbinella massiliensis]